MKEVTYEEWQKNPTPRMMWVWDNDEKDGYQPNGCFYGDDYLDDYCYEDKDGDFCCDKTKEEIENDIDGKLRR